MPMDMEVRCIPQAHNTHLHLIKAQFRAALKLPINIKYLCPPEPCHRTLLVPRPLALSFCFSCGRSGMSHSQGLDPSGPQNVSSPEGQLGGPEPGLV